MGVHNPVIISQGVELSTEPRVNAVELDAVSKSFGSGPDAVHAVSDVTLEVVDGEFLTLLGPSGSGKTTVLRMIAGFEMPTTGTILLDGADVTQVPPFDRDVNTVFQDYALFPHMTVQANVEYGLKVKKVPKAERKQRATEALAAVRLEGYGDRKPTQLSGGQRQRVALARALVNRPKVLLLDEPLGALDLKLREQMQIELKEIQRQVGITFIFVTHDQEEALTMSDRIAVFHNGGIEQVGTPDEIYERPATEFVAGFVGTSNLLRDDAAVAVLGRPGLFSIRPEKIRLAAPQEPLAEGEHGVTGTVREVIYLGTGTRFLVDLSVGGSLMVLQQNLHSRELHPERGADVMLTWRTSDEYEVTGITADQNSPAAVRPGAVESPQHT